MRTRNSLAAMIAAVTITAGLVLTGCTGTGTQASAVAEGPAIGAPEAVGGAVAMPPDAAADQGLTADSAGTVDGAGTPAQVVTTDRQIVRTAYVAMQVDDVAKTAFAVHGLVAKQSGVISNEQTQASGDYTSSMITAQIPSKNLDAFVTDVSKLGTVDSVTVTADDVTTQVVDLDARIKALQASIDRMTQLLAQAKQIDDLLAIETQLSTRQSELDSLTAQRKYLATQVAMSTATITLSPVSTVEPVDAPGFLTGLENGWAAFVSLVMIGVTAIGFLLPFLLIALCVIAPVVVIVVRHSRKTRMRGPLPTVDHPTEPVAPAAPAPSPDRT